MEQVFDALIGNVDIILIDSPAGLERDAIAAMSPADEMILVTTPEVTSLTDTLKTKLLAERMGIDILGVVLNKDKYDDDFLSPEEVEAIMDEEILTIIPERKRQIHRHRIRILIRNLADHTARTTRTNLQPLKIRRILM